MQIKWEWPGFDILEGFSEVRPRESAAVGTEPSATHRARVCHSKEAEPSLVIQPSDELWG